MRRSAEPRHGALETESESTVHERAVLPQIEIPAICVNFESFFLNSREQLVVVVLALRTADDLAIPFRRQTIGTQHGTRIVGILLHVKCLRFLRVVADEYRRAVVRDEQRFVLGSEVFAPRRRAAFPLQRRYRVGVGDAREGTNDGFEIFDVALKHLEFRTPTFEHALRDVYQHVFLQLDAVVQVVKRHLGLDHPELGQMTPRLRFLGAKRGTERVNATECSGERFAIQLTGLREIGAAFVEILGAEQSGALTDRGGQDWRIAMNEVARVKEIVDRLLDLMPHTHQRHLARRAQPEVPVIHQEIDAVLLRLDRIIDRTGAKDRQCRRAQFSTTRRARFEPHLSSHRDRRLDGERGKAFPYRRRDLALYEYALHNASPVTHHEKRDLALRTYVLHPTAHGDHCARRTGKCGDVFHLTCHCSELLRSQD